MPNLKRRIAALAATLALAAGIALAGATPAAAATENVIGYYHSGYSAQLFAFGLTSGTCNQEGYTWTLNSTQGFNLSSVRLASASSRCNYLMVMNVNGRWYGECINHNDTGIPWFGSDYNDRALKVHVRRDVNCGAF